MTVTTEGVGFLLDPQIDQEKDQRWAQLQHLFQNRVDRFLCHEGFLPQHRQLASPKERSRHSRSLYALH